MKSTYFSSIVLAAVFCIQIFHSTVNGVIDTSSKAGDQELCDESTGLSYTVETKYPVNASVHRSDSKLYIVYLGERRHDDPELVTASHHEMLTPLIGSMEEAANSIVYSYKHGFSGFAAMLNESQVKILSEMPDVISVTPNRKFTAHTTRSWDFLGLGYDLKDNTLLQQGNYGEDIIIGVIDTGIWPESRSFDDTGYGPAPKWWKGVCQTGDAFNASNCNNKIIGARWYGKDLSSEEKKGEYMSPRDFHGHGTHTASTAAGNIVPNTSFHGLAAGSVRGGAPRARLAIYKACWGSKGSCDTARVMAAVDHAIDDGVDIMSISIGTNVEIPGTLHAVAKGITVVFAAGNNGPAPYTVQNNAPWVISVAASTIDRSFPTVITLGNSKKFMGQSLFYESKASKINDFTELVYGGSCDNQTLAKADVTGKIVLCYHPPAIEKLGLNFGSAYQNVQNARASGLIYAPYKEIFQLEPVDGFPYALVDVETLKDILYALDYTSVVKISPAKTLVGKQVVAPKIASFSSRGPNPTFSGILKPDIAAPGVNILAAMGGAYKFDSGTSMACPHVSGIVALLKSVHPDWSPAAIKSAIVTTAFVVDAYDAPIQAETTPRKVADPFDYGGGHIDPNRAADPGLIYDINPIDYAKFFNCTLGPADVCDSPEGELYQLNVPSVVVPDLKDIVSIFRTVTNVGPTSLTYKAFVQPPAGVTVFVEPNMISFDNTKSTETFKVTFVANRKAQDFYTFGSLTWSDGLSHSVRIPIVVRTILQDFDG